MNKRAGAVCLLAAAVVCPAGCGDPDLTPVPTVASGPWACAGVPMRAIELMSGLSELSVEEEGSWSSAAAHPFSCTVRSQDEERLVLTVLYLTMDEEEWTAQLAEPAQILLPEIAARSGAVALDGGGVPGEGYAYLAEGGAASGAWMTGETRLFVDLERAAGGDRDRVADVGAMLVSMLPRAFGGQEPARG